MGEITKEKLNGIDILGWQGNGTFVTRLYRQAGLVSCHCRCCYFHHDSAVKNDLYENARAGLAEYAFDFFIFAPVCLRQPNLSLCKKRGDTLFHQFSIRSGLP